MLEGMRSMVVCATLISIVLYGRRGAKLTIANAIPAKAPTLLIAGVQSAPNIPVGVRLSSSVVILGLGLLLLLNRSAAGSVVVLVWNKVSTHGSRLPNATPAIPHSIRYVQSLLGLIIPST